MKDLVDRALFDDLYASRYPLRESYYDVAPGGGDFVFVEEPPEIPPPTRLVLIPDWADELRAKLRAASP